MKGADLYKYLYLKKQKKNHMVDRRILQVEIDLSISLSLVSAFSL
jgi:hypothetical protein